MVVKKDHKVALLMFTAVYNKAHWSSESNLSLYSLYYTETCNEFVGSISMSLRQGNTARFRRYVATVASRGNTVSAYTGPRFEPQTSRSREECVTAQPASWIFLKLGYRQIVYLFF